MPTSPILALNDGRVMPQFGLGVWQTPAEETAAVVKLAVEMGYRSVDTAAIYRNEEGVGEGLKAAGQGDVFLTTKLWNEDQGYDSALRAFDASAKRLGAAIDLYLIHWPSPQRDLYLDSWKALVRLKQEGRVGSIGVSNFEPEHLERIIGETGVVPAVNQIELHPAFQQTRLRAVHAKHGIRTESWSPLGQAWAKGQDKALVDPTIAKVAAKHGKTAAQAIIRWHIDSDLIVIPKSVNPERIAQNMDVFDFALDAEDMAAFASLDRADGRLGPDPLTATF